MKKNIKVSLKTNILSVSLPGKKTKSILVEGFSNYSDFSAEKKFRKKRNLNYTWALMG
jgi:hypothetical protein